MSIDILAVAALLGENPRKEQTVVRMGHGVQRGTPTHLWIEAVQVWVLGEAVWEMHYRNMRQK